MKIALFLVAALCYGQGVGIPNATVVHAIGGGGGIHYTGKICINRAASSTNPSTCTWSASPVAGENVYCFVSDEGGGTSYSFSDSALNTYSTNGGIFDPTGAGNPFMQFGYTASLPGTITTTSAMASATPLRLLIMCFTVTDGSATPADGVGTAAHTTGTSISTTVSPAASSSLLFAVYIADNVSATFTPGTGFTIIGTDSFLYKISMVYKISSSSGSNTCDWTSSIGATIGVNCAAYK